MNINRPLYNYVNKEPLKLLLTLLTLWSFFAVTAGAEETAELSSPDNQPIVFVELFSTQACGFCPDADKLLSDIIQSGKAVGFGCHVDYFDVKEGSLSQPFCSKRQADYTRFLQSGPTYTPQMIINGLVDVMGHKTQQVLEAIDHVSNISTVSTIALQPLEDSDHYQVSLDAIDAEDDMPAAIWLAYIDQDHDITVADGANRGQDIIYKNIVSKVKELQAWDGGALTFTFSPMLEESHKGFLVFVQSQITGKILASSPLMQSEDSES